MDAKELLAKLKNERITLDATIATVERMVAGTSFVQKLVNVGTKTHGRRWTPAERKAMSLKQKAMWAKKRKKA
jgi:hypothetical protein